MEDVQPWGQCQPRGMAKLAFAALKRRLVRGALKRPLYRFIHRRCPALDVEFEGIQLRCHIADNGPERFVIFQERRTAWDALRLITDVLAPGDTFVDVGANFGLFSTVAARKVGPGGRVVAIEPHPELARRLAFNTAVNEFDQISIVRIAVGNYIGDAVLHSNTTSLAESSLNGEIAGTDLGERSVLVPIMTLHQIANDANLSRINALKIDIEGYEDRALIPFFDAAPKSLWPRRVLIEVIHSHDWTTDCVAKMLDLGYVIECQGKSDALLLLRD